MFRLLLENLVSFHLILVPIILDLPARDKNDFRVKSGVDQKGTPNDSKETRRVILESLWNQFGVSNCTYLSQHVMA